MTKAERMRTLRRALGEYQRPPAAPSLDDLASAYAAEAERDRRVAHPFVLPLATATRAVASSCDRTTHPAEVVALACLLCGVEAEDVRAGSRQPTAVVARAAACYAMRRVLRMSGLEAGLWVGSSHSVVFLSEGRAAAAVGRDEAANTGRRAFQGAA